MSKETITYLPLVVEGILYTLKIVVSEGPFQRNGKRYEVREVKDAFVQGIRGSVSLWKHFTPEFKRILAHTYYQYLKDHGENVDDLIVDVNVGDSVCCAP